MNAAMAIGIIVIVGIVLGFLGKVILKKIQK